jgi:hypothetical protein
MALGCRADILAPRDGIDDLQQGRPSRAESQDGPPKGVMSAGLACTSKPSPWAHHLKMSLHALGTWNVCRREREARDVCSRAARALLLAMASALTLAANRAPRCLYSVVEFVPVHPGAPGPTLGCSP